MSFRADRCWPSSGPACLSLSLFQHPDIASQICLGTAMVVCSPPPMTASPLEEVSCPAGKPSSQHGPGLCCGQGPAESQGILHKSWHQSHHSWMAKRTRNSPPSGMGFPLRCPNSRYNTGCLISSLFLPRGFCAYAQTCEGGGFNLLLLNLIQMVICADSAILTHY